MKKRLIGLLCGFLAFMMLFTILSRAADSVSVAQVSVSKPQKGKIDHVVSGSGKVVQNREQAVSTQPNQVVKTIYVEEGQQVQEGELLFEIELDSLKEQILELKQNMEIADLQSEDKASGREAQAWQRATAQNRAAEDYSVAAGKADTAVARAAKDLNAAKKKLKALKKAASQNNGTGAQDEVAAILQQAYNDKQAAYQEALSAKEELQAEIDEAVRKALEDAKAGKTLASGLVSNSREMHGTANGDMAAGAEMTDVETGLPDAGIEQPDTGAGLPDAETGLPDTENSFTPPTQTQLTLIEQQVRRKNQPYLDTAEEWIAQTKAEMEQAKQAFESYMTARASQSAANMQALIEQQLAEVQAKQNAYNDAVTAKNDSLRDAGRAVEDASAPEASDSTGKIDEITREQQELALSKLEEVLDAEGKITAPISGVVTRMNLTTGERTPDGTAILLADTTEGNKLVVQVPAEQEKYIARQDEVTIRPNGNKKEIEGLTVDSVRMNDENQELLDITVKLPEDTLEIGTSAELRCVKTSETYEICIPIQALHMENNRYFVYVLQETQSVLGNELTVRRVDVTVLDKNETTAALSLGSISSDQQIAVSSDKYIEAGSRVRLQES